MKTRLLPAADPHAIAHAVDVLRAHGIVAFPTDTVYGLGAGAFDPAGVDRLYAVKGRNQSKAIAVLLADADQLSLVAENLPESARKIAAAFWPGPLTLVVPRHPAVPAIVSQTATLGVRIPDHPVARRLIRLAGPLAVTSANLSGGDNTTTAAEVMAQLGKKIDLILDGGTTPGGVPSTVVDCTRPEPVVLRAGPLTLEQIRKVL